MIQHMSVHQTGNKLMNQSEPVDAQQALEQDALVNISLLEAYNTARCVEELSDTRKEVQILL